MILKYLFSHSVKDYRKLFFFGQYTNTVTSMDNLELICPDLSAHWQIDDQLYHSGQVILQAKIGNRRYQFEAIEGYALKHFTGKYTARQVLNRCRSHFNKFIPAEFIVKLLQQLTDWEILLTTPEIEGEKPVSDAVSPQVTNNGIQLKSSLEWIYHPEDYWILRNPENLTNLQIDNFDKEIISQLQLISIPAIANQYDITLEELQYLLQMLAGAGMLEGINPQKPPKKFNLMQLFYYQIPVFNPDAWLTKHIDKLRWIWT